MSKTKQILIVDDEPNVRLVFRTALESPDYTLFTAEDGETALRWLKADRADLVLLDLQMPGMDGMEVLRRLREMGNDVPVVIVTAHGSIPNAVQAMRLGTIDFLTKPLSPEALRAVAAEVLSRHDAPQPVSPPRAANPAPVTAEAHFAENLARAKRAMNQRAFEEADVFLKQAIGLKPHSAEAHNLTGVMHELREEHDDAYRAYRLALKADKHYEPSQHNMQRYYERFTFGRSDVPIELGRAEILEKTVGEPPPWRAPSTTPSHPDRKKPS